jgi:hypothetical protein
VTAHRLRRLREIRRWRGVRDMDMQEVEDRIAALYKYVFVWIMDDTCVLTHSCLVMLRMSCLIMMTIVIMMMSMK